MIAIKPSHPLALYMQGQRPWLPFSVRSGVEGEEKGFIYLASWVLQGGHKLTSPRVVGANHYGEKDTRVGSLLPTNPRGQNLPTLQKQRTVAARSAIALQAGLQAAPLLACRPVRGHLAFVGRTEVRPMTVSGGNRVGGKGKKTGRYHRPCCLHGLACAITPCGTPARRF